MISLKFLLLFYFLAFNGFFFSLMFFGFFFFGGGGYILFYHFPFLCFIFVYLVLSFFHLFTVLRKVLWLSFGCTYVPVLCRCVPAAVEEDAED